MLQIFTVIPMYCIGTHILRTFQSENFPVCKLFRRSLRTADILTTGRQAQNVSEHKRKPLLLNRFSTTPWFNKRSCPICCLGAQGFVPVGGPDFFFAP